MGEIGNNINNHIDNKISQKPVKKQRISFRCGLERTPSKDSFTRTEDNKTSEMRTSIGGKLLSSFYPQRPEPEKNSPPKNLIADDPEFKLAQQKMTIISQQDEIEDLKAQLEAERAKTAAQASRLEEQQAEIKSVTDALEEAIEKGTDESLESKFTAQFQQIADDAVSSYAFVLPQDSIIKQNLINKKVYKIGAITPFEPISTEYLPPINTAELKKEFAETGNVDIKIPESYDTKPVKADNAYIGDSNPDNLNKTISSKMTVEYGKRINWSNQKIARDMLQNFYDGHGNTLDGVEISAEKQPDGKTKIKISGKALYDFEKLQDFGSGNKIENPYNAGGFGEGSRILVANLIGKKEAETITYSSADWRLTFCEKEGKIHETLTKADEPIDGNTLEFETDNDDFVKALYLANLRAGVDYMEMGYLADTD
ncbi:hypothetical protein II906_05205, partial [bacterium]|nr:hypothetical protein [bacterium]